MYKGLSPYAISVPVKSLEEAIAAARTGGFGGVEFNAQEVATRVENDGPEAVKALFAAAGVLPAGWGLPVDWRGSEEAWWRGLTELPRLARSAAAIGGTRTSTWIMPASNNLDYAENWAFHVERFAPIATILAEYGCALGLEFFGPKTLRDGQKYPFVFTLPKMVDLGQAIGPNVGLLLDCWHWYTSRGTVDDIRKLKPEQVVYVHVNDAPAGVDVDSQIDNTRALPGETGVIDIVGFLSALREIGYDGPVTPEPFKKELADLPDNDARLKTVGATMTSIFDLAGL